MTTGLAASDTPAPAPNWPGLALVLTVNALALALFAGSPHAHEHPAAALGILAFFLVQLLLPACRPDWETPLCPANLAQGFFWVQVVLVPVLIGLDGLSRGTLPRAPAADAVEMAIVLRVLGYVAFSVTYQLLTPAAEAGAGAVVAPPPDRARAVVPIACAFAAVGILGLMLAYQGPQGYLAYLTDPAEHKEREETPATTTSAIGTLQRPFLGFGLVLLWSWWLGQRGRRDIVVSGLVTLGLFGLLLLANFSYNRGSMLAPLVGVAAAFSRHVRRLPVVLLAVGGGLTIAAALAFGWYRSTDMQLGDLATVNVGDFWADAHLTEFAQIYGSGPQMTAFLIEERGDDAPLYLGSTLVCSILYPVPALGKAFREGSGVSILNMLIYQDPENVDQIIAYDAELFINLHLPGVVLGYALLGGLLRRVQSYFLRAPRAVESYAWLQVGLWLVFPGSLPVFSQMCVYFFWPLYVYVGLRLFVGPWLRAPAPVVACAECRTALLPRPERRSIPERCS